MAGLDPHITFTYGMHVDAARRERDVAEQRERRLAEDADLPGVFPEPDDRPTPRSQWDEVHGRWVEWDEAADTWTVVLDVYGGASAPAPGAGPGGASGDEPDGSDGSDDPAVADEPWLPGAGESLDDIE